MSSPRMKIPVSKLDDLDAAIPGLTAVWREAKRRCGTRCRCPKAVHVREAAEQVHLNDGELGMRFELDLATMTLGADRRISSGEWAVHAGSNHDGEVSSIPSTSAIVEVTWHDFYRSCSFTLQVSPGALRPQLPAGASASALT